MGPATAPTNKDTSPLEPPDTSTHGLINYVDTKAKCHRGIFSILFSSMYG
jgi:hypothetical protein